MQPQINAIKQLLETNNAIALVIESVLIEVIGDRASWENSSLIQELRDAVNWDDIESKDVSIPVLQQLWRSRIALNDARINAEEVDLEEFLASLIEEQKQVKASLSDFLSSDEPIEVTPATTRITGGDPKIANSKAIVTNLDEPYPDASAFNPTAEYKQSYWLEKIEERDREIENLRLALDITKKPTDDLQMELDRLRRDLRDRDKIRVFFLKDLGKVLSLGDFDEEAGVLDAIANLKTENTRAINSINCLKVERDDLKTKVSDIRSNLKADCADIIQQCKEDDIKVAETFERVQRDHVNEISKIHQSHYEFFKSLIDALGLGDKVVKETDVLAAIALLKADLYGFIEDRKKDTRDRQIEELQITVKNHGEQFENLKSRFEVLLKAIAMNLDGLKGARKPDETREVNGVMTTFRNYDDNLTHHHKTVIIENVQRAIAEEAKKLKGVNLKDFSFDDILF